MLTAPGFDSNPTLAPDGRSLVVDSGDGTGWATGKGQWDLWMLDLDTGRRGRLTTTPVNDWGAGWSPDGKWLAFSTGLNRTYALTIVAADSAPDDVQAIVVAYDRGVVARTVFRPWLDPANDGPEVVTAWRCGCLGLNVDRGLPARRDRRYVGTRDNDVEAIQLTVD